MGAPAIDRVWALLPWSTLGCSLKVFGFRRSRHQRRWNPFVLVDTIMGDEYIDFTYIHISKRYDGWFFVVAFVPLALSDLLEHSPLVIWGTFACPPFHYSFEDFCSAKETYSCNARTVFLIFLVFRPIKGRNRDIRNKHYFPGHFDRLDQLLFGIGN